jgi:hypothetical protein
MFGGVNGGTSGGADGAGGDGAWTAISDLLAI